MSRTYDELEYPDAPAPLPTDTLADSVLILLGLTAAQRLVGFVRAVLFCRWLDAEQLGLWDMAFSFLLIAAPLSVLAIPGAFGRYVEHFRRRGQLRAFFRSTAVACFGLALTTIIIVLLARDWFSSLIFGSDDEAAMVVMAALCLMTVVAFNFLVEVFTALRNIRLVSAMQMVNSVAFAVLGVGLLLGWQCSAAAVLLSYGGSCLVAILWASFFVRRIWQASPPTTEPLSRTVLVDRVAPFAAWILLGSMLTNLFGVMDRYMIVHFSDRTAVQALDMVGNYHSSRVVPMLLVSIASMIAAMAIPHLSHDWEAGRRDEVAARLRLLIKLVGFALFAGAAVVLLFAPLLFGTAFRGKFPEGMAVLPWTLVYCTWFSLSLLIQNYIFCAERAKLVSLAMAFGLLVNILLNVVLLPKLGLEGAVLSSVVANAFSLVLICMFSRRLGFHLDDGAELILALPIVLSLGPWVAMATLAAVLVEAIWANRLLTPDEKRLVAEGIGQYGRRFKLDRLAHRWNRNAAK